MTTGIIRKDGFDFGFDPTACAECPGRCCRGKSGRVWLCHQEVFQICNFLDMNAIDFMQAYLVRTGNEWSIKEQYNGHDFECIFLEGTQKTCSIYAVRPTQCRRFPFWNHYRLHKAQAFEECPGIRAL